MSKFTKSRRSLYSLLPICNWFTYSSNRTGRNYLKSNLKFTGYSNSIFLLLKLMATFDFVDILCRTDQSQNWGYFGENGKLNEVYKNRPFRSTCPLDSTILNNKINTHMCLYQIMICLKPFGSPQAIWQQRYKRC